MKTTIHYFLALILMLGVSCNGQTPEQRKQAAETEAMIAEMQRKADSMMNDSELKKKIEETNKILAAQETKYEEESAEEKKTSEKKLSNNATVEHLKKLTISSGTAKKFDNWKFGAAELYVLKQLPFGKDPNSQHKVGSISADGSFIMNMPEAIATDNIVSEYLFKCQYVDDPTQTQYTNADARLANRGITIIQNGKRIGMLSLATNRQQVYNDSPYGEYRGEHGYRLEWWYASKGSSAKVECRRMYKAYGPELEITNIYDLDFKPGWNLMKVEILEAHSPTNYKTKKYTVVPSMPNDARWVFSHLKL